MITADDIISREQRKGARLVHSYGDTLVFEKGHAAQPKNDTSHLFHLVMTILTLGIWGIVWVIRGMSNAAGNIGSGDSLRQYTINVSEQQEMQNESWDVRVNNWLDSLGR